MIRCKPCRVWVGLYALAAAAVVTAAAVAAQFESPPSKRTIENPTKSVLAGKSAEVTGAGKSFVNPKVLPGEVQWHATFDAACAAARQSGKPVLLFQMMGRLDEQFC